MPPFNFGQVTGQAFQQSFQAAQEREQQAKRQRALQRLRQRRLEQKARQARKQRQLQQQRLNQQKEAQAFRQEQAVAESMQQMYQNAREAAFQERRLDQQERRLDLRERRIENQSGGQGVMVTNDDFARMNPLGEGQSVRFGKLPKPLQARALQGMMQPRAPTGNVNIFGDQGDSTLNGESTLKGGVPGRQPESPVGEASMTLEPEEVPENSTVGQRARMALGQLAEGFAAPFTAPVNAAQDLLYPEVPQQKRDQARSSLQRGVKEFQKLRRLPPEQRTEPAAQLTRQLEQLRQDLGTFQQTEATNELRKNIRALQKATSRATPGTRGQRALQEGFSELAQKTLQKALEADDLEQMNTALSNLRKSLNQDVAGSQ